jgi:sRNA-binding regulator protein Hfq
MQPTESLAGFISARKLGAEVIIGLHEGLKFLATVESADHYSVIDKLGTKTLVFAAASYWMKIAACRMFRARTIHSRSP